MNPYTPALNWQSRAILGRHVRVHLRNWHTATLPPVCEPLIMLLAFGVGLGAQMGTLSWRGQSFDYLHYLCAPEFLLTPRSCRRFSNRYLAPTSECTFKNRGKVN